MQTFFVDLDDEFQQAKSSQAKKQTKTRILSEVPSKRPAPSDLPSWATTQFQRPAIYRVVMTILF